LCFKMPLDRGLCKYEQRSKKSRIAYIFKIEQVVIAVMSASLVL